MKKIKLFTSIVLTILLMFTASTSLKAASGSISVRSSRSSLVVGNQVTVTVTVSSTSPLGSWEYSLNYDSSKLKLISGNTHIVDYASNGNTKSASYTYTFKSISKGKSTVSISSSNAYAFDESQMSLSNGSTRISAITQEELEASYSKNNNLKTLGVEGYTLNEEFSSDKLEYSVSVPSDVLKVTLTASVEDKTASITGLGEVEVSEGENKFEIKVTAQNGSVKTYILKVNVEDKNPIEVVIDNVKYTIVKRASTLTAPNTFKESTTTINGIEVPSFISDITKYTLVGLKSETGETNLYIYDNTNNTYTLYKELKTNGITLFIKEPKETLKNFTKTNLSINEQKVNAYTYKDSDNFYIVYGVNIETGLEGYYQYDKTNNAFIKYDNSLLNNLNKRIDNYLLIIIVLGVETLLLLLILLISFINNKKRKKKIRKIMKEKLEKDTPLENKKELDEEEKKDNTLETKTEV